MIFDYDHNDHDDYDDRDHDDGLVIRVNYLTEQLMNGNKEFNKYLDRPNICRLRYVWKKSKM